MQATTEKIENALNLLTIKQLMTHGGLSLFVPNVSIGLDEVEVHVVSVVPSVVHQSHRRTNHHHLPYIHTQQ